MTDATLPKDEVERIIGVMTLGAATLAMVAVLLVSESLAVARPFATGIAPLSLVAAFGLLTLLYVHYGR
ncbi:hypothetical protein [Natronomonas sp. EA1]|uniref:hypothetical protein n=1 Tax=Natronomonas sp. EA1 TaxID=3421655 RepID=UPI003EB69F7B